jgi:two-component system OmpR family sensor kinase
MDGGAPKVNHSLQQRLAYMIGLAIVVAGLIAAVASFFFAYFEAEQLQDETLRDIALLTADRLGNAKADDAGDPQDELIDDTGLKLVVVRLSQPGRPAWLPQSLRPGFHTLESDMGRVRVYVSDASQGRPTAVGQPTAVRDQMAMDSALRTLIPVLILLPVLVWLTTHIVNSELAPLRRLAERLDAQSPEDPHPVPDRRVPEEVRSFVHAINRLLTSINRLMGAQRRFIADAAHELRGPLTALSLQAQNLEEASSVEAMRERIDPLKAGIERARRLTEQLLNLAKAQAGKEENRRVDLSTMVRETMEEFVPAAEARGIDLGLAEIERLEVVARPDTLRLILKDALDNALAYTPVGGQVTIRLMREGPDVVIEVLDTGPGIPIGHREQVFEPFYRIPGSPGSGSGLGLAIARDAAARAGGIVTLHDGPGGLGLLFRYTQKCQPASW